MRVITCVAEKPRVTVPTPSSSPAPSAMGARKPGARLAWIGQGFLGLLALAAVVILSRDLVRDPRLFLQIVISGLQLGFVYALIALGYTMVYGIVRLINFAHGDVFMVGAFLAFYAVEKYHLPLPAVFVLAAGGAAILAVVIERVAYRPLRNAPKIAALITAIGVSLFLEYFTALHQVFGPNYYAFPRSFRVVSLEIGGITFTNIQGIIFLVTLISLGVLQFVVHRTKVGRGMRAASYDNVTAGLMGVNVNAVISFTFGLGAAL